MSENSKKKKKKFSFFFLGGGGGGSGWGGQGRCEQRSEVFVKISKKNWGGGGGSVCENLKKIVRRGGGVGSGEGGSVWGGSGWMRTKN